MPWGKGKSWWCCTWGKAAKAKGSAGALGQGREGLNIPVVRLAAAGFDRSTMLSLMLLVGSALHQDIAMGMLGIAALLPALARPFVTTGAACK